ncbi:adenomatous polyposis coli protein [Biomphalaria pfeifferi]|uniref:Adenomatous polyposis coli protein n=1 Tax=Biomphalaria pfeifferi TaxID=112525 RepID=A0AAD8C8B6_BIOPF|nr:adenomatous polyposis coli protein [Biomphalaria pfeifferi]
MLTSVVGSMKLIMTPTDWSQDIRDIQGEPDIKDEDEDPDYDEVYDGNISLEEEERLLAENDTNSEISTTWSDKNSDFSSATLAENKSHGSSKSGPKIVKPGMNLAHVQRLPQEDCAEDAKGIRGRRKPLYPGKSNNAKVKPGSVSQNTKIVLPQKSASVQAIKKTPPKQPMVAQMSPRTRQPGQSAQINNSNHKKKMQKKTSPMSRFAGPTPKKFTTNGKQFNARAAQGNSSTGHSSMTKPVVTKSSSSPPSSTATKKHPCCDAHNPSKLLVNTGGGSFPNTVL